ncbi:MAG: hypothetical protein L0I76_27240 [Pseudonocardia sp.]|nr:hypothetical protein [Actinomycetes bacterium]MDN5918743.1 hypothetical protein [Pseudonocardia sp.]
MSIALPAVTSEAAGWVLAREVALPVLAVAGIVVSADVRIPLGLPGHRGLVWLTLLVTVALVSRTRQTVVAVGAASTMATLVLGIAPGPGGLVGSVRYVAAAVLLYAVATTALARRHRWLVALAAAPIHLVALVGSIVTLIGGGYWFAVASVGTVERVAFHLGFGLVAGLLGWAAAAAANRTPDRPDQPTPNSPMTGVGR